MSQNAIATCNAGLNARNVFFNGGTVEIRSGAAADIDATPAGTVLVTFTLPNPAFANASNRISTMNTVPSVTATVANAGGQVHYVAKDSGSAVIGNGTAGTSGTDMILNTLTWGIGDDVTITTWNTAQPK